MLFGSVRCVREAEGGETTLPSDTPPMLGGAKPPRPSDTPPMLGGAKAELPL
jgi:hypothetical protein